MNFCQKISTFLAFIYFPSTFFFAPSRHLPKFISSLFLIIPSISSAFSFFPSRLHMFLVSVSRLSLLRSSASSPTVVHLEPDRLQQLQRKKAACAVHFQSVFRWLLRPILGSNRSSGRGLWEYYTVFERFDR